MARRLDKSKVSNVAEKREKERWTPETEPGDRNHRFVDPMMVTRARPALCGMKRVSDLLPLLLLTFKPVPEPSHRSLTLNSHFHFPRRPRFDTDFETEANGPRSL